MDVDVIDDDEEEEDEEEDGEGANGDGAGLRKESERGGVVEERGILVADSDEDS